MSWRRALSSLRRTLESRRAAVLFIGLLLFFLLLGRVLPQRDEMLEEDWLAQVEQNPGLMAVYETLGLNDIASSPILYVCFVLLYLNLGMNMVRRLRTLPKQMKVKVARKGVGALRKSSCYRVSEVPAGATDPVTPAVALLSARRFKVVTDGQRLSAVRNRSSLWGSVLFHGSMFVIGVGGLLSLFGRFHALAVLGEGEVFDGTRAAYMAVFPRDLPEERLPELRFSVHSFNIVLDDDDNVLDTMVVLEEPDGDRTEVRVNQPFRKGNVAVRLTSYGLAPVFTVREHALGGRDWGAAFRLQVLPPGTADIIEFPGLPVLFEVRIYPDAVEGPEGLSSRTRRLDNPLTVVEYTDRTGTLREVRLPLGPQPVYGGDFFFAVPHIVHWVKLEVHRDSGRSTVYAGLLLALLGMWWRLFLPVERIDALMVEDEEGRRMHFGGKADYTRMPFAERFERLVDRIEVGWEQGPQ
ncbi:MAG: cytochrome c biogenesis protein ResB [Deltaproteobacteria bacterium]|jgi:cytochrome c biogenesis protein ResB|nr:cytochrome c biogenesis protein ResB [Deltaproteobacteria bacterium]MBW2534355.1 cytochrome c biogenesis protein ResB [Deltaproteobacteria bacterium]